MAIEDVDPKFYGLNSHAEMHEIARAGIRDFSPEALNEARLIRSFYVSDYDTNEAWASTDYARNNI